MRTCSWALLLEDTYIEGMESKIKIYQSPDGETTIDIMFEQDTLNLKMSA